MPESQLRRVRHLHLHSTHETLNRRGAILLEDALRTASLPDAHGSRLLLVRRLSLDRFRANAAPASLALLIEQRVSECGAKAVSAQDPSAPLASAVYFQDAVEPYINLAVRLAKQESIDAWFWPLAVRGWNPGTPRDEAFRVLLAGVCQTESAWAGVLSLVRILLNESALSPLLVSLRRQDGPALLALFGWSAPPDGQAALSRPRADRLPSAIPADWQSAAGKWIRSWGGEDTRSRWLAGVLSTLAARQRGRAYTASISAAMHEAKRLIETLITADQRPESVGTIIDFASERSGAQTATVANAGREPLQQSFNGLDDFTQSFNGLGQGDFTISPLVDGPMVGTGLTSFGGLFFLIAAMRRAGLPDWLQNRHEIAQWDFPALILRAVARRLRAPEDDPVLVALDCSAQDIPAEVDAEVRIWIRTLRRWCRCFARIGLYSLICRPGRIRFTQTHIDVAFQATEADVRVRKAGLDIDPGWTPWLGRVLHFHYLSRDEFDTA
jgi:hypothetical protein